MCPSGESIAKIIGDRESPEVGKRQELLLADLFYIDRHLHGSASVVSETIAAVVTHRGLAEP